MTKERLIHELRFTLQTPLPLPGSGRTVLRHKLLMEIGRNDLSLARLAEAHWDAVAILAEAGREAVPGALYGVWASEIPGQELVLRSEAGQLSFCGSKKYCSGAGIVDRALITVNAPREQLFEIDLRKLAADIDYDESDWKTAAFADTGTATAIFRDVEVSEIDMVGDAGWYVSRPGFWHGACGPAACWAGGALGLVGFAMQQRRSDPHTTAHLGAMYAGTWALASYFETAGIEIDADPTNGSLAMTRALTVRHLVEQACTDILRRFPRAFGPHPLAMNTEISRRYHELDLYLRQSHAERDLELLGRKSREIHASTL